MFNSRRLLAMAPLLALLSLPGFSQPSDPAYAFPPMGGPQSSVAGQTDRYSSEELDTLLKPLALFPDPLLAQILPAATFPDQVQAAGLWLQANPGGDIDSQPWDDSVKAIAHYPTVVEQLNTDLQWTEAVGVAFSTQSAEVTSSVQRLRRMAYDSGNLGSNAQQVVNDDQNYLTIMPPTNQVVYVPSYNPQIVYGLRPVGYYQPLVSFSIGYACGSWLSFGYDWLGGGCYRYPRGSYWGYNYAPAYRNVGYIHNTYNSCAWSAPRYSVRNVTINNNYRPGGGWSQQRNVGYQSSSNRNSTGYRSNGNWSQQQSPGYQRSGYRPGGDWSRRSGQPGSQTQNTRSWSQNSDRSGSTSRNSGPIRWNQSGGYKPGGSWSRHSGSSGMPSSGGWSPQTGGNSMPSLSPSSGGGWSRRSGGNSMPSMNPSSGGGWSRPSGGNSMPSLSPSSGGSWSRRSGGNSMPSMSPSSGGSWSRQSGGNSMPSLSPSSGGGWSRRSGGNSMPSMSPSSGGSWSRQSGGNSMPSMSPSSGGSWSRRSGGNSAPSPSHSSGGWSRSSGSSNMPSVSPSSGGGWNRNSGGGRSAPSQSSGDRSGGGRRGRR